MLNIYIATVATILAVCLLVTLYVKWRNRPLTLTNIATNEEIIMSYLKKDFDIAFKAIDHLCNKILTDETFKDNATISTKRKVLRDVESFYNMVEDLQDDVQTLKDDVEMGLVSGEEEKKPE